MLSTALEEKLRRFSAVQVQTVRSLLKDASYDEDPEVVEGKNKELCLIWEDGKVRVTYEVQLNGVVSSWFDDISSVEFEKGL